MNDSCTHSANPQGGEKPCAALLWEARIKDSCTHSANPEGRTPCTPCFALPCFALTCLKSIYVVAKLSMLWLTSQGFSNVIDHNSFNI